MSIDTLTSVFSPFAKKLLAVVALALCVATSGCAHLGPKEVKPWQKGNLAKWHMMLDTDPLESRYVQHVYFSKEGSVGGYGLGGGGCGCN